MPTVFQALLARCYRILFVIVLSQTAFHRKIKDYGPYAKNIANRCPDFRSWVRLIDQSAKELNIPANELIQMSAEQIEPLAKEKLLDSKIETYQFQSAAIKESRDEKSEEKAGEE